MTVYVDSSVLLWIIFGDPGRLREWNRIERPFASETNAFGRSVGHVCGSVRATMP